MAQGDTLADPTIPPAFAAVIAGGDPAPAVAIARDRLLPTLDEGQVLLGEMRTSPLAEDYVAGLDQRTQAFESALNAFVADPSAETATAVDETGRAFDLGLFAQTNVVAVQRDLFATECDPT